MKFFRWFQMIFADEKGDKSYSAAKVIEKQRIKVRNFFEKIGERSSVGGLSVDSRRR